MLHVSSAPGKMRLRTEKQVGTLSAHQPQRGRHLKTSGARYIVRAPLCNRGFWLIRGGESPLVLFFQAMFSLKKICLSPPELGSLSAALPSYRLQPEQETKSPSNRGETEQTVR